ncbi:hypothetical protein N658DRAFT_296635 [Parathielavia hyrcaniae]|uniref:Uncharacterized protein n=1 Tax=Parathielavia hyrcaniae TaxID=113614 RepID=A0AAN6PSZ7_9PEZI|nr:hypothetical protein N658DRAFT_296635 [Parathielavia hyrcaniae]
MLLSPTPRQRFFLRHCVSIPPTRPPPRSSPAYHTQRLFWWLLTCWTRATCLTRNHIYSGMQTTMTIPTTSTPPPAPSNPPSHQQLATGTQGLQTRIP